MLTGNKIINTSDRRDLDDLIIVGMEGEGGKRHRKKVQKINEIIEMRIERKKRIKELMTKRSGNFNIYDNKL